MLGIGFSELLLILFISLIFIGPEKLPAVGRTIGKTMRNINNTAKILTEEETAQMLKKGHESEEEIYAKAFEKIEKGNSVDVEFDDKEDDKEEYVS